MNLKKSEFQSSNHFLQQENESYGQNDIFL